MTRALATTVAAVLAASTPARAGEPATPDVIPPKARTLAERGRAFHEAGDYASAIAAFKEAYVLAPSPGLLFNLAQAYRLAGNCDDASLMYRRYLATRPRAEARVLAEEHLHTVERCVHKQALHIPPDALTALPALPAPSTNAPAQSPAPEHSPLTKRLGMGLIATSALATSLAVYYGLEAHDAARSVEDAYAQGAKWSAVRDLDARGQRDARTAAVLGVAGGVALAGGITLYVLGRRREQPSRIAVAPTRGGAEVSWAWRY